VLKAELRGLLSQAHPESIHDRIENILTSNVFGIFSYLDPNEALLPFLRTASDAGLKPMEVPERCVRVLWRFWPRLQRGKIPDVLLVIESPEVDYVIAIEAKYHARKHGVDDDLDAGPEDPAYSAQVQDQLAKYLVAIKELVKNKDETRRLGIDLRHRHVECAVLYVTQDSMMPIEELEGTLKSLRYHYRGLSKKSTQPDYPVFWSNWGRAKQVVDDLTGSNAAGNDLLKDLAAVLERKGFSYFCGLRSIESWHTSAENCPRVAQSDFAWTKTLTPFIPGMTFSFSRRKFEWSNWPPSVPDIPFRIAKREYTWCGIGVLSGNFINNRLWRDST